jgi:hypothetical protein
MAIYRGFSIPHDRSLSGQASADPRLGRSTLNRRRKKLLEAGGRPRGG